MIKYYLSHHIFRSFPLLVFALAWGFITSVNSAKAQSPGTYMAPQDTVKIRRSPNESITTYKTINEARSLDSRMVGAAVKAAELLKDTSKYDIKKGIALEKLFEKDDLEYLSSKGVNEIVALFEQVNKFLPKDHAITFRTEQNQNVKIAENPLVLKDLRAMVAAKPATIRDPQQWKENVYHAYMARDYGTKLHNTITKTSATREIRETPDLEIIAFNGSPVTLKQILAKHQSLTANKFAAEKSAVAEFRAHTFPSSKISKENANENYKRALFQLISLQEADIMRHPETRKVVESLINDLKKGKESNVINSLKSNRFFDANVPGNLGPVLLTEDQVISPEQILNNAEAKGMELMMLTALHYGERDAVKLFKQLINDRGSIPAKQTGDFTTNRLGELTDHGTEKLKSLGYGSDKTSDMTSSDLVLMAVSAPEAPLEIIPNGFITMQQAGACIVNQYSTIQTEETRNTIIFSPRIKLGSRHTQYRASYDPVDFVPEFIDGVEIDQQGSQVLQNGAELRFESDIYFCNPKKIIEKGVKPTVFPQFGAIMGVGKRSVGKDNSTTMGRHGPVPQFKNYYLNWGGYIGINVGPFMLGMDATYLSSQPGETPNERFFDLSHGMTYYRYTLLTHILNYGLGKFKDGKGSSLLIDFEFSGETNNTGFGNHTISRGSVAQIGNDEWRRDYDRAHPGGVYNSAIATSMILNGDTKANYAASNYASLNAGIEKSGFQLRGSMGLYNIYSVTHDDLIDRNLFKNTMRGNLFGTVGLTYTFGSKSSKDKRTRKESYQIINNVESPRKIEESSSSESSSSEPRDHAIFTNKRGVVKPLVVD